MSADRRTIETWCPVCGDCEAPIWPGDGQAHCPACRLCIPRRIVEYGRPADATPVAADREVNN